MRAYRELYFDEIVDAARRGDYKSKGGPITTQRPTKAPDISREPLSLESFRSKLQGDAGKEYYEKLKANPEEFDRVMKQLAEQG
jgi:predicted HD phosphohydrolase